MGGHVFPLALGFLTGRGNRCACIKSRDGEMWVSVLVLVLGAAEHPVFSAAGAAVPLLPPACDCQLPDICNLSHSLSLEEEGEIM